MANPIRVDAMCMTCPNRLHATDVDSGVAASEVDRIARALGWRDDFPNGNWLCDSCIAIASGPSRDLARDLTVALGAVLGTEGDDPGFEETWDLAEATCDRAREVLGIKSVFT